MHGSQSSLLEVLHAATDRPTIVVVGERRLFAIDGVGGPDSAQYRVATETLRRAARNLALRLPHRPGELARPGMLETAWWTHPELPADEVPDAFEDRASWHWQQLVEIPARATNGQIDEAMRETSRDGGRSQELLRVVSLTEGRVAQMLHIGGSGSQAATLRVLYEAVAPAGLRPRGHIHELRLADEHEVPMARVRSILRLPIEPE
jgi:hypothetical protein